MSNPLFLKLIKNPKFIELIKNYSGNNLTMNTPPNESNTKTKETFNTVNKYNEDVKNYIIFFIGSLVIYMFLNYLLKKN